MVVAGVRQYNADLCRSSDAAIDWLLRQALARIPDRSVR
jgi:hypothetical protein